MGWRYKSELGLKSWNSGTKRLSNYRSSSLKKTSCYGKKSTRHPCSKRSLVPQKHCERSCCKLRRSDQPTRRCSSLERLVQVRSSLPERFTSDRRVHLVPLSA